MSHHQETPHHDSHLDAWHAHAEAEGLPQREHTAHINVRAMFIVFVLMVVAILVMVVGLTIFYQRSASDLRGERLENTAEWREFVLARDRSLERISGYRGLSEAERTVQIPVEQAEAAVIERYAGGR